MSAPSVFAGWHAGEERGERAGVVAGAVAVGLALSCGQAGEDEQLVLDRGQRLEDGGQLEAGPLGLGVQSGMCMPLGT